MIPELRSTPGVYLVGFMGCGKTSVGRIVAEELAWRFVDIDEDIEEAARTSISEIFDTQGENEFRALEAEAIAARVREVQHGRPSVVALGGGAFAQEGNCRLLNGNGISIWLDCPLDILRERVAKETHRPLARDPERFAALYEARREACGKANYRIDASGEGPQIVARRVLDLPIFGRD